jgi:predicted component of type VI protein secretion system
VIRHARVSRLHARIEYRRDAFVFVDQSTNGSQVIETGQAARYLRRDECRLLRAGKLVLGPESAELSFPSLDYRLGEKHRAG